MAFFGVTWETIETVKNHPNADRLDICTCENLGYQFVTQRDKFKSGDRVLYFPIDALLSEMVLKGLGLEGKLSGKDKNKVKTAKIRGVISQGIVARPEQIANDMTLHSDPEALTMQLGITKYEPVVELSSCGNMLPLPEGLSVYDIEGCERNKAALDELLDKDVYISEKVEGTNFSISKIQGKVYVNQRTKTIVETDGEVNKYWEAARKSGLVDIFNDPNFKADDITVYAELCGPKIQDNIYGLKDYKLFIFDIKHKDNWESYNLLCTAYEEFVHNGLNTKYAELVPLVFKGPMKEFLELNKDKTIQEISDGQSKIRPEILREGIVIKPVNEHFSENLRGRLILKQRSPKYLEKEKD